MSNMTSNGGKLAGKRKASDNDEVTESEDNGNGTVYIKFSIRSQEGKEVFFKVNETQYLRQAFQSYCRRMNLEYGTVHFMLYGKSIRGERETPKMLRMVDGDQIDAAKHQTGGGGGCGGGGAARGI